MKHVFYVLMRKSTDAEVSSSKSIPRLYSLCSVKYFFLLFLFFLVTTKMATSQVTFIIDSLPASTLPGESIYIAGNFNNWNPGHPSYELHADSTGNYRITLNLPDGAIEFKFTRGSWASVEGSATGGYIPNRKANVKSGDTLYFQISGWENQTGGQSTAAWNVAVLSDSFYMPQLNRYRRIWIYLPPDYDSSRHAYPVLYMHDGQNLFDRKSSFLEEWKVDERLNALFAKGDSGIIVVGIDNGGIRRIDEYSPWQNPQYGGGEGEEYVQFIANTLKPHIDSLYRTRKGPRHTGIMGSSMGGLISLYGGLRNPEVFGKIGVFSPSLWFSEKVWSWMDTVQIGDSTRIYLLAGAKESQTMVKELEKCDSVLLSHGMAREQLFLQIDPNGTHSETFWGPAFPAAYAFLFSPGASSGIKGIHTNKIVEPFPNPASDYLELDLTLSGSDSLHIIVYNAKGEAVMRLTQAEAGRIDIRELPAGLYYLHIVVGTHSYRGRFVKQ